MGRLPPLAEIRLDGSCALRVADSQGLRTDCLAQGPWGADQALHLAPGDFTELDWGTRDEI